jgi:hypothetical protein
MPTNLLRSFIGLAVAGGALSVACGGTSHATAGGDGGEVPGKGEPEASAPRNPSRDAGSPSPSRDAGNPGVSRDAGPGSWRDASSPPPDATAPAPSADAASGDASDGVVCHGMGARFATGSPEHSFGPGQNTGQDLFPAPVLGPPKGGGMCMGSTDVVSLGNGGSVVLEFADNAIVDGPGPDFIVFENPFGQNCDPDKIFAELGTVGVSQDGVHFTDFPCTATMPPFGECSGWHPVFANADTNSIDPTDPAAAGGDSYDLADAGMKWARYVRVTDRADITGTAGVYDLDAVSIVHPACP